MPITNLPAVDTDRFRSEVHPPTRRFKAAYLDLCPGKPYPLGAMWDGMGVNFALYSEHAERVELLLFDTADAVEPSHTIELSNRTGPIWHGYLLNFRPGQLYGYRVYGPYAPEDGHRFNHHKVLLDPYAKAISRPIHWDDSLFGYQIGHEDQDLSFSETDSAAFAPLGQVTEHAFDWGGDRPLDVPWNETIIYEAHVKGISKLHPEVPEPLRGTYLGLVSEPILEHFEDLGVTTVQLLPVHAKVHDRHLIDAGLSNYWGYNTLAYFAPEPEYASSPAAAVQEFKMMVRTLHARGFEVIIDVVYNHTGEGSHLGPTLSWRGIDNRSYYKGHPEQPRYLMDYTGTGNTLDTGTPYVVQMITDSLRYWVQEMHVDGFRFDLASALARELYDVEMLGTFFQIIQQDPVLSQVKLIAEPWDVGPGGYQVGGFPWQWAEWNGRYRDTVREFWRDGGHGADFATRFTGSSDLYALSGRRPFASINFVTAHDGFTLQDLVSYAHKHNEANQEGNRDGDDHNSSTNGGVEGPTDDPHVLAIRAARKRSFIATLMLSQGVPMLLGGDELSRTKRGNNNTYCQDNDFNWFDWDLDEAEADFLAFVQRVIAFRKAHPTFRRRTFLRGEADDEGRYDAQWWHADGREMDEADWHNGAHTFGLLLRGDRIDELDRWGRPYADDTFFILVNAHHEPLDFTLPENTIPDLHTWVPEPPFITADQPDTYALGETVSVPAYTVLVLRAEG